MLNDKNNNIHEGEWDLLIAKHKGEKKDSFKERKASIFRIMSDIYNRNRVEIDPPTSDSKI